MRWILKRPAVLTLLVGCILAQLAMAVAWGATGENLRRTVTVRVVEQTKDAVVYISTTKMISRRTSPFGDDPFFNRFGGEQTMQVPANSLGSGFLIHRDGYVVTNNHVIDRARQITVELTDGRKLPARLISADAEADLAVLKIQADAPLPALPLGDSGDLLIGEPVIAVGNPLGYSHSVSTGIVSAIHRDLKAGGNKVLLGDLIQTDAAINPGNSGGPLLNAYGQVIGINTAIRSDAQNIGFAIQVNRLRDLIPELMNPSQANQILFPLRLNERRTVSEPAVVHAALFVGAIADNKPLLAINGRAPSDIVDAYAMLLQCKAGQIVTITWQGGTEKIALKPLPPPDALVQANARLGLTVQPNSPMLAQKYSLAVEDGLIVTAVERNGPAARGGIEAGDVIVRLGRYQVGSLDEFGNVLNHLPDGGRLRLFVVRGNQIGYATVELRSPAKK